jgi:hypothetical protein
MKIYVVFELGVGVCDDGNCQAYWKVIKGFVRQEDAERYVKSQKYPADYDIEEIEFVEETNEKLPTK